MYRLERFSQSKLESSFFWRGLNYLSRYLGNLMVRDSMTNWTRLQSKQVEGIIYPPICFTAKDGKRYIESPIVMAYWLGLYEPEIQSILRKYLRPGSIAIDIGANVGFLTLIMSKIVSKSGRVYAFEPVRETANTLMDVVEVNNISNVQIVRAAVSSQSGSGLMNYFAGGDPFATLTDDAKTVMEYDAPGYLPDNKVTVQTITLDDFFDINHINEVDLIKIDAEGAEIEILKGMGKVIASLKPKILVEFVGDNRLDEGLQCLKNLNYKTSMVSKTPHATYKLKDIYVYYVLATFNY